MQYHYVVFYDTDTKKWSMEYDVEAYFGEGHVWDDKRADETGYGWFYPGDDMPEESALDDTLRNTLYSLVDIISIPKEHEHATS